MRGVAHASGRGRETVVAAKITACARGPAHGHASAEATAGATTAAEAAAWAKMHGGGMSMTTGTGATAAGKARGEGFPGVRPLRSAAAYAR